MFGNGGRKACVVVSGTLYRLCNEVGYADDSSTNRRALREIIRRLSKVSITTFEGTKEQGGFNLLSYSIKTDGSFEIALNPKLTTAVLGKSNFTSILMDEVRAIKMDVALLIYLRLCGFINQGRNHPSLIDIETLVSYAWPHPKNEIIKKSTQTERIRTVKKAMNEIKELGWEVDMKLKDKYFVGRPLNALAKTI